MQNITINNSKRTQSSSQSVRSLAGNCSNDGENSVFTRNQSNSLPFDISYGSISLNNSNLNFGSSSSGLNLTFGCSNLNTPSFGGRFKENDTASFLRKAKSNKDRWYSFSKLSFEKLA